MIVGRVSLFVLATALAAPALAADEPAQDDTIVVTGRAVRTDTATRTDTPPRLIPQAIDQVDPGIALDYGLRTLTDALTGVPNVQDGGDTRFDGLLIRGFSASSDLYLDGLRDDAQYVRDLRNIERVEVLKGPAAVLYGRGSLGGIVNRITKKPEFDRGSAIHLQAGSFDLWSGLADINAALSSDVALRLNAGYSDAGSFRRHVSGRSWIVAPSVLFRPAPDTQILLQYEASLNQRTPDRGIPGLNGRPAPVPISTYYGDPERDIINDRVQSFRGRVAHAVSDAWELRYTGGLIALDNDFTNTYVTGVNAARRVTRALFGQELDATIQTHSLETEGRFATGPLRHHILVGVEGSWQVRHPLLTTSATAVPTLALFDPDLAQQYRGRMVLSSDNHHRARNLGLFVQDQIGLPGGFDLLLGVRADRFHIRSITRSGAGVVRREARETDTLSPRIGLVWTPSFADDHSFYATWSKGFAPVGGGTIGVTPATTDAASANNALAPEKTRLFEVGLKSDWTPALSTTLSLYDLDLYNRRTADPDRPGYVILLGRQRSRGAEASVTGRIAGAFGVRGGIGYQDARILRDTPAANGSTLAGKRPANIADLSGSAFAFYRPERGPIAEAGIVFSGERFADNANTVVLPRYERIDAMLGWRFDRFDLRVAATNIGNVRYFRTATSAGQIQPGAPRTITASLTARF